VRRTVLLSLCLGLALLVTACGKAPEPDARTLEAEGDAFAERGAWAEAAERYRLAFALEDPVPERAAVRARLAWRRGIALARCELGEDAWRWFQRALDLDRALYVVHFELGLLHDGHLPETADRKASRQGFERFLAGWERAGSPKSEAAVADEARRRLEALGD